MSRKTFTPLFHQIQTLVRQIPSGHVTTYGTIARLLNCSARTVGFAMASLPEGHELPWQRVVNSQGRISPRRSNDSDLIQRRLLETEGVRFDSNGAIDLNRYGWNIKPLCTLI